MKLSVWGFLRSLISNLMSELQNSRRQRYISQHARLDSSFSCSDFQAEQRQRNKISEIYENVEVVEIPSDGESDDNVENSKEQYFIAENGLPVESTELDDNNSDMDCDLYSEFDEYDDIPLSSRVAKMDGIWEDKSICQYNPKFTERSGPKNFSERIDKADEIFLCLFSVS